MRPMVTPVSRAGTAYATGYCDVRPIVHSNAANAGPAGSRATIARDDHEGDDLAAVPLIGAELAARIRQRLGIDTYEDLEAAAHDGRLETVPGIGPQRAHAVCEYLDTLLSTPRPQSEVPCPAPPVELLLAIDSDYRHLAEAGRLHRVAPRRFNPQRRAWLPVWHTVQAGWSFTAMYSNTARAHDAGKLRDWVVIVYARDGAEAEATVVTEHRGGFRGMRVVRGRETECRALHTRAVCSEVRDWAHRLSESLDSNRDPRDLASDLDQSVH